MGRRPRAASVNWIQIQLSSRSGARNVHGRQTRSIHPTRIRLRTFAALKIAHARNPVISCSSSPPPSTIGCKLSQRLLTGGCKPLIVGRREKTLNARNRRSLAICGLLLLATGTSGCFLTPWAFFHESFDDMVKRADSVPIPDSYEFLETTRRGVNPPFFGDNPTVDKQFIAHVAFEDVCAELKSIGEATGCWSVGEKYEPENCFCVYTHRISAGWTSRGWGTWFYTLHLYASGEQARRPDRGCARSNAPTTRVQVSVTDY